VLVNTCLTCHAQFRRSSSDGEIRASHCYLHADTAEPAIDPVALVRLRKAWSSRPLHPIVHGIARPALNEDQRAEARRRRVESGEPWRSEPDSEPTTAEDRLIAALNLNLPELATAA